MHSIVAPIFDAALNWQDAYMEYTAHYPIAEYRVEEAMSMPEFRAVVEVGLQLYRCSFSNILTGFLSVSFVLPTVGSTKEPGSAKTESQVLHQPTYLSYPTI